MMSDYARTQELLGDAQNSSGAAQEQYDKTLESLDSKLNILKDTWDEFVMGIANSDGIKFAVDLLNKVLEVINKLTTDIPVLSQALKGLMAIGIWKGGAKLVNTLVKINSGNLQAEDFIKLGSTKDSIEKIKDVGGGVSKKIATRVAMGQTTSQALGGAGIETVAGLKVAQKFLSAGKFLTGSTSYKKRFIGNFAESKLPGLQQKNEGQLQQRQQYGQKLTDNVSTAKDKLEEANLFAVRNEHKASLDGTTINAEKEYQKAKNALDEYNNTMSIFGNTLKISKESTDGLVKIQQTLGVAEKSNISTTIASALAQGNFNAAMEVGKIAAKELGMALITNPLTWIFAGIAAIQLWNSHLQKTIDNANEVKQAYDEVKTSVEENKATIESIRTEFDTLSKGIGDGGENLNLSTDQYERYKEIVSQLVEISPSIVEGYDAQGNAIINTTTALKELNEEQDRTLKNATAKMTTQETLQGFYNELRENGNLVSLKAGEATNAELNSGSVMTSYNESDYYDSIADYQKKISALEQKKASNENTFSKDDEDYLKYYNKALLTTKNNLSELQEKKAEYANVIQSLSLYAQSNVVGGAKVSEQYGGLFTAGIQNIAYSSTSASEAQAKVQNFISTLSSDKESLQSYLDMQDKVQEARDEYLKEGEENYEEYNNAINNAYKDAEEAAEKYLKSADETMRAVGESMMTAINNSKNFASEQAASIEDALNPLKEYQSQARQLEDTLSSVSETDYSVGADSAGDVLETALNENNTAGYGSKYFWETTKNLVSDSVYEDLTKNGNRDIEAAQKKLKELQKYFTEGEEGAYNFYQALKEKGYVNSDGSVEIKDNQKAANAFGMSMTGFSAAVEKLQQFGNFTFSNPDELERAIYADEKTIQKKDENGDVVTGEGRKTYVSKDYIQQQASAAGVDYNQVQDQLKGKGINIVDFSSKKSINNMAKELGYEIPEEDTDVTDYYKNIYKTLADAGASQDQIREYIKKNASDQQEYKGEKLLTKDGKLNNAAYSEIVTDYTKGADETTTAIQEQTSSILSALFNIISKIGGDPTVKYDVNGNIITDDSDTSSFPSTIDGKPVRIPEVKTKAEKYTEEQEKELEKSRSRLKFFESDNTIKKNEKKAINNLQEKKAVNWEDTDVKTIINSSNSELQKAGIDYVINLKYQEDVSSQETQSLLEEIEDDNTKKEVLLDIKTLESGGSINLNKDPWKSLLEGKDTKQATLNVLTKVTGKNIDENNMNVSVSADIPENVKNKIKAQISNLNPIVSVGAIFKNGSLKGLLSKVKNLSPSVKVSLSLVPGWKDVVLNKLKGWKPTIKATIKTILSGKGISSGEDSDAKGRNLAGSAAKGAKRGKIGPKGKGGLTLTGELGPELVWLPDKSQSFLTGVDGPEMQNLPSNAVVWPHDQTKKIMNSSARGQNFGSAASGGTSGNNFRWSKAVYSSATTSSSSGGTNTNTSSKKTKKSSSKKKSDKWENSIDKWYNNSVKAEKYLRQAERLQDEYDDYLSDLSKSADYMKEYTKQQLTFYKAVIAESQAAMKTINGLATSYKKGNNTKYYYTNSKGKKKSFNAQTYAYWDDNLKMVQINWEKINKVSNEELGSAIEEYLQKLEKYQSEYEAYQDKVTDALDSIKEMADNLRDGSIDWIDDVRSAIEYEIQTQIDTASSLNETIEDSNSKLMDSLNNAISKSRQERENKDTEKDIADKRAQLAALQRDTSGSNATKIKQLQEEIKDAEQDYTDSLVDQKLDEMQDAMDEAADQRSQMIDILERQLDWQKNSGILSQMAWDKIQNMDSESLLNYVLNNSEDYKQGSSYEKEEVKEEKSGHQKQFTNASTTQMTSTTGNNGLNTKGAQYTQYETLGDEVGTGKLTGTAQLGDNAINYKITQVEKNGQTGFYETTEASKTVLQNGSNLKGLQVYNSEGKSIMTLSDSAKLSDDGTTITDGKSKITGVTIQNGQLVTNNAKQKNKAGYQKGYLKEAAKLKKSSKNIAKRNTLIKKAVRNMIDYGTISYKGLSSGDTLKAGEAQKLRPVLGLKKLKKAARFSYAESQKLKNNEKFSGFKTGGLADYTGTAWLDGTPSKPELVLNAEDTKNFIQLKDILSSAFSGTNSSTSSMGDNYYEISINVDKMNSDYDVEQVANKIKKMIVNDAKYRGVTSVRRSK